MSCFLSKKYEYENIFSSRALRELLCFAGIRVKSHAFMGESDSYSNQSKAGECVNITLYKRLHNKHFYM